MKTTINHTARRKLLAFRRKQIKDTLNLKKINLSSEREKWISDLVTLEETRIIECEDRFGYVGLVKIYMDVGGIRSGARFMSFYDVINGFFKTHSGEITESIASHI